MPSLSGIKDKVSSVIGGGELVKAAIYSESDDFSEAHYVQFNPSEYTIQRGTKTSENTGVGKEPKPEDKQSVKGQPAVLSVTLYFDGYSELVKSSSLMGKASSLAGGVMGKIMGSPKTEAPDPEAEPTPNPEVNALCDAVLRLIKYNYELHRPPLIHFVWGDHLHFIGNIVSDNVQYTAFAKDGAPVRATAQLEIEGEESHIYDHLMSQPNESPDRTKQRLLPYGDQIWMLAEQEYGDPGMWKVIAEANGILNPRALSGAARLKVPSIQ